MSEKPTCSGKEVALWAVVETGASGTQDVSCESKSFDVCEADVADFEAAQVQGLLVKSNRYATIPARYADGSYDDAYIQAGGLCADPGSEVN